MRLIQGLVACGQEAGLLCPASSPLFHRAAASGIDVRPLGCGSFAPPALTWFMRTMPIGVYLGRNPFAETRRGFPARGIHAAHRPALSLEVCPCPALVAVSQFVARRLMQAGVRKGRFRWYMMASTRPRFRRRRHHHAGDHQTLKGSAMIRDRRLAGVDVHFSHELETDIARARLFLYASFSEGLGSAVLLAMAAERAPAYRRPGGRTDEVIDEEANRCWFRTLRKTLPRRLRELFRTPASERDSRSAARATVADRFSIERMVRAGSAFTSRSFCDRSACCAPVRVAHRPVPGRLRPPDAEGHLRRAARSYCPACEHQIAWHDNIPLASYLLLPWEMPLLRRIHSRALPDRRTAHRRPVLCHCTEARGYPARDQDVPVWGCLWPGLSDLEERILPDEFTLGGTAAGLILAWFIPVDDFTGRMLIVAADLRFGPHCRECVARQPSGRLLPTPFSGWAAGHLKSSAIRKGSAGRCEDAGDDRSISRCPGLAAGTGGGIPARLRDRPGLHSGYP